MKPAKNCPPEDLAVDRESDTPLYAQLRNLLSERIQTGQLQPGQRLPAVAELARRLGVTQSTVTRAFEDLSAAGHLESHVGRGTFVKTSTPTNPTPTPAPAFHRSPIEPADPEFALAARRLRMGIARSLDALNILAQGPGLIDLTSGTPDPSIARADILAELTNQALLMGQSCYQGYGWHQGMPELREQIARRQDPSGKHISAENVMITSGSQQAVSLLAQTALEQNLRIVCEVPFYPGIANAFGAIGHWVESVPRDIHGPLPDKLRRIVGPRPILFYLCPELHNPMGTDLSNERRAALLEWAQREPVTIVADEIFRDLRFEEPAPPSLLHDAGPERTITVGSLSKSFMCGLRVGWLITSQERIRSLAGLKRATDISCPPLMQGIAHALMASGAYDQHLARAIPHYRTRRDAALSALATHMPNGVTWSVPSGGFHLWAELPAGYSSIALYLLAIQRGVVIAPGPRMDIDHRFIPAFRLSYGSVEPDRLREGIELLANATRELLKAEPSDPGLSGLGSFL